MPIKLVLPSQMELELIQKACSAHNWVIQVVEQYVDVGFSRQAVSGSTSGAQTFYLPINREESADKTFTKQLSLVALACPAALSGGRGRGDEKKCGG